MLTNRGERQEFRTYRYVELYVHANISNANPSTLLAQYPGTPIKEGAIYLRMPSPSHLPCLCSFCRIQKGRGSKTGRSKHGTQCQGLDLGQKRGSLNTFMEFDLPSAVFRYDPVPASASSFDTPGPPFSLRGPRWVYGCEDCSLQKVAIEHTLRPYGSKDSNTLPILGSFGPLRIVKAGKALQAPWHLQEFPALA